MNLKKGNNITPKALLALFVSLLSVSVTAQTLEAHLDSARIRIGSQTQLTLTVTAPKDAQVVFPEFEPKKEMVPGLEVVKSRTDTLAEGHVCRTYTLTAWDENKYNVPALTVRVGNKELRSNAISLEVTTIKVDTTANAQPRPPHDVADNPFSWDDWSQPFWYTLIAAVLLALCYYFWLRLRQNKPIVPRVRFVRRLLPHQKALKEIARLKSMEREGEEGQKAYYTGLTDALRLYLDERFGIKAKEMTSGQIVERLQEQEGERTNELQEVFQAADLVKFARFAAESSEDDRYLQVVADFIDETKQENQPTVERVGRQAAAKGQRKAQERLGAMLLTGAVGVAAVVLLVLAFVRTAEVMGWL